VARARILVVEDDKRLAKLLTQELAQGGYEATVVHTGTDALVQAQAHTFALILLDLNLPDMDGIEVAERLRGHVEASILMLTARGDVGSRVEGLYAGASDYLTKPFSIHELLARIHVRLRERQTSNTRISHKGLELDPEAGTCLAAGESLVLTAREFTLLNLLLTQRGRTFSKEDLEDRLYGPELPGSNTVEVFISNLRKKLAAAGVPDLISTVRGMGYVVR
jgi:DNA-binding response OmpR family regulator